MRELGELIAERLDAAERMHQSAAVISRGTRDGPTRAGVVGQRTLIPHAVLRMRQQRRWPVDIWLPPPQLEATRKLASQRTRFELCKSC